ncbi:hypothetical protein AMECASPLE_022068 [Ameca splendens]|uniref:Secreted protein n=1 Tax=Ameca splendens TaxID=208324 RepID=A0ABV0XGR7_9TELE
MLRLTVYLLSRMFNWVVKVVPQPAEAPGPVEASRTTAAVRLLLELFTVLCKTFKPTLVHFSFASKQLDCRHLKRFRLLVFQDSGLCFLICFRTAPYVGIIY